MEKLSLSTLSLEEMEKIQAGTGSSNSCNWATGSMCFATIALLSSAFFAPFAGATGVGCALGIYAGCYH
jgi:hypothetical protein